MPANSPEVAGIGLRNNDEMPLSDELRDVLVEFSCPICSHPIVKPGSWLRTIGVFNCEGCKDRVRIGYEEKLEIFGRYLRKPTRGPQRPAKLRYAGG